ncbi:MAG: hypothetical protein ABIC82_00465 [bacterium]
MDEIFANPIFERLIGKKTEVEELFEGKFDQTIDDLEKAIKV